MTLPVHLETLLPRASASYGLRTEVDVREGMRGRPLTLAIAHMSALATLRADVSSLARPRRGHARRTSLARHASQPPLLAERVATRASDVFALGIIAFEVLTGRRPFPEAPMGAKLAGRPLPAAMPFARAVPELPAEIAALLDRGLSHDPRTRPSAKELASALKDAA